LFKKDPVLGAEENKWIVLTAYTCLLVFSPDSIAATRVQDLSDMVEILI
jgi:hypothetical protein